MHYCAYIFKYMKIILVIIKYLCKFSSSTCYVKLCWLIRALLLELSGGILSCILCIILNALSYTMLIFGFPCLCTLRWNRRNDVTLKYKIFTFITTIFFYLYITIHIIHKCTLNSKDFLVNSPSSNFWLHVILL